jgi:hypothetical protein
MEKLSRKELKDRYKNRVVIGGVYCIKCKDNGRMWVKSTKDMEGSKNRFEFSVSINSCIETSMSAEWNKYGAQSFSFAILEEVKKGEIQTDQEFADDISVLFELWIEKQQQEDLKRGD